MKSVIHPSYKSSAAAIKQIINNFDRHDDYVARPARNAIKAFQLENEKITVKRFKIPNLINKVAYRFLRKSKAERSYQYANRLLELGIGTPQPLAYFETTTPISFLESYYVCRYVKADFTYRELIDDPTIQDRDSILRAFTRFTYQLHESGILFKDHSPGNTLIQRTEKGIKFYLVDLNRMEFKTLTLEERILNFTKLTPKKDMVEIMSDEYAKLVGEPYEKVVSMMWSQTAAFQERYWRKVRVKKKLYFWRKAK